MENNELPLGLGMALAQNSDALEKFAALPESRKQEIINGTHSVTSKGEMRKYVERALSLNSADKGNNSRRF